MKRKNEHGMSLIGFIFVLSLVVFVAYLAMRIIPIYTEFYTVRAAMQGIREEYQTVGIPQAEIKRRMLDRLYISQTASNVSAEDIKLVRSQGLTLSVKYEVRKPVFGNLDIIASFDESVFLSGN